MVTWKGIIDALPQFPVEDGAVLGIWGCNDEIVCKTEDVADAVVNLLENLGWNATPTKAPNGYYHLSV